MSRRTTTPPPILAKLAEQAIRWEPPTPESSGRPPRPAAIPVLQVEMPTPPDTPVRQIMMPGSRRRRGAISAGSLPEAALILPPTHIFQETDEQEAAKRLARRRDKVEQNAVALFAPMPTDPHLPTLSGARDQPALLPKALAQAELPRAQPQEDEDDVALFAPQPTGPDPALAQAMGHEPAFVFHVREEFQAEATRKMRATGGDREKCLAIFRDFRDRGLLASTSRTDDPAPSRSVSAGESPALPPPPPPPPQPIIPSPVSISSIGAALAGCHVPVVEPSPVLQQVLDQVQPAAMSQVPMESIVPPVLYEMQPAATVMIQEPMVEQALVPRVLEEVPPAAITQIPTAKDVVLEPLSREAHAYIQATLSSLTGNPDARHLVVGKATLAAARAASKTVHHVYWEGPYMCLYSFELNAYFEMFTEVEIVEPEEVPVVDCEGDVVMEDCGFSEAIVCPVRSLLGRCFCGGEWS